MRVYLRVCVLPVRMRAVYVSMNGGGAGWLVAWGLTALSAQIGYIAIISRIIYHVGAGDNTIT